MIPYGKQTLGEDDIQSVLEVLKENVFLTTGPKVTEFEEKVSIEDWSNLLIKLTTSFILIVIVLLLIFRHQQQ